MPKTTVTVYVCHARNRADTYGIAEFAGLENDGLEIGGMEFSGLENDRQENARLHQYGLTFSCLEYILLTASLLLEME